MKLNPGTKWGYRLGQAISWGIGIAAGLFVLALVLAGAAAVKWAWGWL